MIIEMPFLHRLCAATSRSSDPREMAAWDMERLRLEELSYSDFEPGADLGEKRTLLENGNHWASLVGAVYHSRSLYDREGSALAAALKRAALNRLANEIDCTRFFAEGRTKLSQTSILKKTPKPEYIHTSQREANIAKLTYWVNDNLVSVEGEVFVKVRDPAVYLDIVGPFEDQRCYMILKTADLHPVLVSQDYGILATINGRHELNDLAHNLLSSDSRMMRIDSQFAIGAFDKMHCATEDTSDMAARTLVSIARRMTWSAQRVLNPPKFTAAIAKMFKEPEREFDQVRIAHLADLLAEYVPAMKFPLSLMTKIALERWHDRPISLGIEDSFQGVPGPR